VKLRYELSRTLSRVVDPKFPRVAFPRPKTFHLRYSCASGAFCEAVKIRQKAILNLRKTVTKGGGKIFNFMQ
jgi:hypothetical protein